MDLVVDGGVKVVLPYPGKKGFAQVIKVPAHTDTYPKFIDVTLD